MEGALALVLRVGQLHADGCLLVEGDGVQPFGHRHLHVEPQPFHHLLHERGRLERNNFVRDVRTRTHNAEVLKLLARFAAGRLVVHLDEHSRRAGVERRGAHNLQGSQAQGYCY